MKNIGIWMDKEKAHIVRLGKNRETFETIFSNIEFFNPKGGSGTKFKGGPQDVVQDSKYLEREKHQMKSYFNNLTSSIHNAEVIALFGPADTAEKFRKELNKSNRPLASKIITVSKADSMTNNQIKALVRNFYKTSVQ